VAVNCSFDVLESGRAQELASNLLALSAYFVRLLRLHLVGISTNILSLPAHLREDNVSKPEQLPSPIIPIMTSEPHALSAFLHTCGMNARPITWPTVPKGKDRVRVCLHAGNKREDIERLVKGMVDWAEADLAERARGKLTAVELERTPVVLESKL